MGERSSGLELRGNSGSSLESAVLWRNRVGIDLFLPIRGEGGTEAAGEAVIVRLEGRVGVAGRLLSEVLVDDAGKDGVDPFSDGLPGLSLIFGRLGLVLNATAISNVIDVTHLHPSPLVSSL